MCSNTYRPEVVLSRILHDNGHKRNDAGGLTYFRHTAACDVARCMVGRSANLLRAPLLGNMHIHSESGLVFRSPQWATQFTRVFVLALQAHSQIYGVYTSPSISSPELLFKKNYSNSDWYYQILWILWAICNEWLSAIEIYYVSCNLVFIIIEPFLKIRKIHK